MAAMAGLLPLVAIRWLPGGREARRPASAGPMPGARSSGRMAGAALRLPLRRRHHPRQACSTRPCRSRRGFPATSTSAALLVQAITATLSRWQAGRHGDRYGHARLLIPALAVPAALGMAAMIVLGSPVVIFAGMVLFGARFGVIRNCDVRAADRAAA